MAIDLHRLLDTPIFALDQLAIFGDVLSFLQFSEKNIEWQKKVALQQVEKEMRDVELDEPEWSNLYQHERDSILFRFDVALPMRVRYAALVSLVATIEWSMTVLRPSFRVSKPPVGESSVVDLLRVFAKRCELQINDRKLKFVIWVRNSIMHNSDVLKGYKHEADIRRHIVAYEPDFTISNWHYIGDTVEIKQSALEKLIGEWSEIIRSVHTSATDRKLLEFP
jgi:hypothetical protein